MTAQIEEEHRPRRITGLDFVRQNLGPIYSDAGIDIETDMSGIRKVPTWRTWKVRLKLWLYDRGWIKE